MNLKDLYINFFIKHGHKLIPSAPVIPENDPTVLFNTAGMQPLVPYLMGEHHPEGKRLVDYQKCIRLTDLDEVGDKIHHTFFEMLGNWSLGDYFKKESIAMSFEFLTEVLNIPITHLSVTVFKGNSLVPKDIESAEFWMSHGIKENRIAYLGEDDNWWGLAGGIGPCGPDTEIFYWSSKEEVPEDFDPTDSRWVEIWNNVFMQYNKLNETDIIPLSQKNVDTGMGFERTTAILEGVTDNYQTSIWKNIIECIEKISNKSYNDEQYTKSMRVIADHIRTSIIISGEDTGIIPSNTDQGYILRRLIRRYIRHAKKLEIDLNNDFELPLIELIINQYKNYYPELERNKDTIINVLINEKRKFLKTLEKGFKEFEKIIKNNPTRINDIDAFRLYDTFGFPIELTKELAMESNITVDEEGFNNKFKEHQEKSRAGSKDMFKGGLSNHSDIDIKYHTATHLLNAALKKVVGKDVHQKGSNINEERMRFDFSCDHKLTSEEIKQVEELVNSYIQMALPVEKTEMKKEEALKLGAEAMFISKYGDIVTVYKIADLSLELCGGPHVNNTKELGKFKIIKEEASSAGVRRIKAILE